jgi:beta-lactam-binding protein with PASTA domain
MKLATAQEMLPGAGLKLDKVTPMPGTGQQSGTVTSQIPAQGARVAPGDSVELDVAQ